MFGLDARRLPHYRWLLLTGLMLSVWTITWYSFAIGILLPPIRDDLGLNSVQQGWLGASFFLGSFLFTIPLTNLFSHLRPVRLMTGLLVATTLLLFAAATLPNYPAQLVARFLVAVAFVAINPARTLLTQAWFRPQEYPAANGLANGTYGITEPIAFWLTAPLLSLFGGWQGLFVFFGVMGAASTALWVVFAREPPAGGSLAPHVEAHQRSRSPLGVARRGELWWAAIVVLGSSIAWSSFISFWPTFGQDTLDLTDNQTGFVLGFTSVGVLPGSLMASVLLRRYGRRLPMIVSNGFQVATFILPLTTGSVPLLVAFTVLQGAGALSFALVMTTPFQLHDVSPREVAAATALIVFVNQGGLAIGPAAAGALGAVIPLGVALAILGAMPVLSVIGALFLGEPRPAPAGQIPSPATAASG